MNGALEEAKGLDVILLPYENALNVGFTKNVIRQIRPGQSIGVFIGPEGGFDSREVEAAEENGAKILTLGKRILRTETAAISMLSILMYELEA
jgi:16S rRNA (uracil1498-N3)-methyltransferase